MNLPAFCIHRPAFTIVISLVMVIIGVLGYLNLPVRWIPNMNTPEISIVTLYPGASSRLVEQDVTKVIEKALSGINGIEMLTSRSMQGQSHINITFKLGSNMNVAVEEVRGSLEQITGLLPKEVLNPVVMKTDTNNIAVMYISFYSPRYNARELSDYVDKYVMPSFETIDGVANVELFGKQISAMRISLNPAKMAGSNVTVDEITRLLESNNASIPSGQIRGKDQFYSVVTDSSLKNEEQFNNMIIRDDEDRLVRLGDIGKAKLEAENTDSAFRVKGKPAVAVGIVAQSTANPLEVEVKALKVLQDVKRSLPAHMQTGIEFDQADFIRASIKSVYESLFEAVIFVWVVILFFLCNFRATFIPVLTIPVCLISTFALLSFLGFSINTITLMAFVLAIGLVVDDAIVMLENISRHIEKGLSSFAAALKGSKEMIFPIIAMTLTLAAVYTPIAFTPGLLGVLFREFTFTLAGTVIISGIIALTLSPMMCARLLKSADQQNRYQHWLTLKMTGLQQGYGKLLASLIQKRMWVLLSLIVIMLGGFAIYKWMPQELAPFEDMNSINVFVAAPRSASFDYTNRYVTQLENMYLKIPEVESFFSQVGAHSPAHSYQVLRLKPLNQRERNNTQLVTDLTQQVSAIPGLRANVFLPPPPLTQFAGGDQGDSIGLVLMTSSDYRKLQQSSEAMMDKIKQLPGFAHVENALKWDSEQFQININADKAADLKLPMTTINNTLSTLLAGKQVGKMDDAKIFVQLNKKSLANPRIFDQLYARNTEGQMVPLSQVITVNETTLPDVFRHFSRLRADTIYVTLMPNFKITEAIKALEKIAKDTLPEDIKYTFTGEAKSFLESNGKVIFTFGLALLFIYLVLVAQFESFIDPLIIMLTVPFAMIGALITLKLFGGTLNIYSNIGMITLIGLIAKHGILITEFANRERAEGKSILDAIRKAAQLRLRPILMTTAAMVLGALPLALAWGPGGESRQQIGLVITGGLIFGTFFSLIVVPIAYTYLSPFRKKFMNTTVQLT